ncbi:MAG: hemerythrin domain-containing protein [Oscillospiraceae bacterium]|nr:hemerythrin domain-containing protein [Oscillospiraceae bacterium]
MRSGFLFLWLFCVEALAEDEKALKEELRDEVDEHGEREDQVLIPAVPAGEQDAPPDRQRREHEVVGEHLEHGDRDVRRTLEGEFPVEGEVPQNAQRQGDKVVRSVLGRVGHAEPGQKAVHQGKRALRPVNKNVQQGKGDDLDDPGADRKQREFYRANEFFSVFFLLLHTMASDPKDRPHYTSLSAKRQG